MDNITNLYKGLDKELLDMTYGDKYYRDVINPAKLGKGPLPSRMEMIGQNLKNFGPVKAMFIGAQPSKYGERATPTKAAHFEYSYNFKHTAPNGNAMICIHNAS